MHYNLHKGIKHDFLFINICKSPMEVLKPEPEKRVFKHLPRVQQMLMYPKGMFDRYYCIKYFFAQKLWRKLLQKVLLTCTFMARKRTLSVNVLKTPFPRQRLTSLLLCTLLMMTSVCMMAPECLFVNQQSRGFTARKWPCFIHGFVLIKTWLLIMCDTAFHVIIHFIVQWTILT